MQSDPINAAVMDRTLEAMGQVAQRKYGIPAAEITLERELSTLGFDSLAFIEYAFELEGELDVSLPDLPRDMQTVGDLARFVAAEVARKPGAASG